MLITPFQPGIQNSLIVTDYVTYYKELELVWELVLKHVRQERAHSAIFSRQQHHLRCVLVKNYVASMESKQWVFSNYPILWESATFNDENTRWLIGYLYLIWISSFESTLGSYHFLPNRGAHEKLGVTIFSWEIGGAQKNQEIIRWLQILMKILFNEIAPKMHIFHATSIGGYMFLQHCSSGGGS